MAWPQLLEVSAVILGVIYVVLAARPSVWCWPFGIVGSALSVLLFVHARLYSEALLHGLYVVLGVVGWLGWHGRRDDVAPGSAGFTANLAGSATAAAAALLLGGGMGLLTDAARPLVDAFTTTFAVWATLLTARKARESWLYWVVLDAVSCWLYASRDLPVYAALMGVYSGVALVGWWRWGGGRWPWQLGARRARSGWTAPGLLLEAALIAGAFVVVALPPIGWGAHNMIDDSVAYVAGARGLLTEGHVLDIDGAPLTIWAPVYAWVLALVMVLPGPDVVALAVFHAVGAWAWARSCGALAADLPSPWLRWGVAWAVLLAPPTVEAFWAMLSEGVFLPLVGVGLLAVARDLERPTRGRWIAALLVLSLIPLARYIGVLLLPVVVVAALAREGRPGPHLRRWGGLAGLAALPFAAWLLGNLRAVGSLTGRYAAIGEAPHVWHLPDMLAAIGRLWVRSGQDGAWVGALVLLLALGGLVARPTPRGVVSGAWVVVYLAGMMVLSRRLSLEPPSPRYLLPLLGPLIVLVANALAVPWAHLPKALRAAALVPLGLSLWWMSADARVPLLSGMRPPPDANLAWPELARDEAMPWMRGLPAAVPIVTDAPAAVHFHTARHVGRIPLQTCEPERWPWDAQGRVAVVDFDAVPVVVCADPTALAGLVLEEDLHTGGARARLLRWREVPRTRP